MPQWFEVFKPLSGYFYSILHVINKTVLNAAQNLNVPLFYRKHS